MAFDEQRKHIEEMKKKTQKVDAGKTSRTPISKKHGATRPSIKSGPVVGSRPGIKSGPVGGSGTHPYMSYKPQGMADVTAKTPGIIAEYTVKKGDTISQIAKNYYGLFMISFLRAPSLSAHFSG
jgi:LysM repeat protein